MNVLLPIALSVLVTAVTANNPVCIVGAGPSGLAAAHALEAKGEAVVVFEKLGTVGGKCQAYYDATYHPLGGVLFTNGSYPETVEIIKQTNVTATKSDELIPKWAYNWHNGDIAAYRSFTDEEKMLLQTEIEQYSRFWKEVYQPIGEVGYRHPIPADFTKPTLQWLTENGYKVLPVVFNLGMFVYGYGDIRQTPIWYMLQFYPPTTVLAFAGLSPAYLMDFHALFVQYAKTVKGDIHLNASIAKIDRSGATPTITYSVGSYMTPKNQTCAAVILAFPPTVAALEAAKLDLTSEERNLFSSVIVTNYFSAAVSMSQNFPAHEVYYANSSSPVLPPDAAGQPVGLVRFFDESTVATTWSWGALGQKYTEQQYKTLLTETLSKINKNPQDPTAKPVEVTEADIKASLMPDYSPTVSGKDLESGWYQRLDKQQGQGKTYFASGLNGFEIVEFSLRAAFDVVEHYF